MDHRIPLKLHTVLPLAGVLCHVGNVVGMGSNAIVYRGWYEDTLNPEFQHQVLVKELFPLHPEGKIHRGGENEIVVEPEARDFWQMHRDSFEAGNAVHLELLANEPELVGANLNSCRYNGTLYTLLGYSGGRSLQEELDRQAQDVRHLTRRMLRILDALSVFHENGWLHLDISPDNIMLVGQGETERAFLIDYNSARRIDGGETGYLSCKTGYSAPEVATGEADRIGIPSDLYTVAAVFFRGLMGRKLSISEVLQPRAPEGKESPLLADAAQTVRSMVAQILRKGLNTLPSKRYRTVAQMRRAFQELLERIDCVGVTHWALWENGKRTTEELVRMNPSLRYLREGLYPIRLDAGESVTLEQYLKKLMTGDGSSGLILAGGGMGKTTLLLHTALTMGSRYAPGSPAVFYLSLNGWDGTENFIRRRILMRLRFKPEENTFESAMLALHRLLEGKLRTAAGEGPVVLLLLDGLNEIRGDGAALVRELQELRKLAGVKILGASRSEIPALNLETAKLMPLTEADVEAALGACGLLVPENGHMRQLLRTPLMLSIYSQAGSGGKQPDIDSEPELIQAYLDTLLEKEQKDLPEDSPLRWQLEAALGYVLPAIAAGTRRTGQGLTEEQLLAVTRKCWKLIRGRAMRRIFPGWIGHSRDICGDAENAEEWLGQIVYSLLWQRLGMLMKDSEGRTRVYHQDLEAYLVLREKEIASGLFRVRVRTGTLVCAVLLAAGILVGPAICEKLETSRVRYYDETQTETIIDQVSVCYSIYGSGLLDLRGLLEKLPEEDPETFGAACDRCEAMLLQPTLLTQQGEKYLDDLESFAETGEQVSWSGLSFETDPAGELITEARIQLELYTQNLPLLKFWASSDRARKFCPDFPTVFGALLDADEAVMSKLYYLSCYPHLEGAEPAWEEAVRELLAPVPGYGAEPRENLETLQSLQLKTREEFTRICVTLSELYRAENQ